MNLTDAGVTIPELQTSLERWVRTIDRSRVAVGMDQALVADVALAETQREMGQLADELREATELAGRDPVRVVDLRRAKVRPRVGGTPRGREALREVTAANLRCALALADPPAAPPRVTVSRVWVAVWLMIVLAAGAAIVAGVVTARAAGGDALSPPRHRPHVSQAARWGRS